MAIFDQTTAIREDRQSTDLLTLIQRNKLPVTIPQAKIIVEEYARGLPLKDACIIADLTDDAAQALAENKEFARYAERKRLIETASMLNIARDAAIAMAEDDKKPNVQPLLSVLRILKPELFVASTGAKAQSQPSVAQPLTDNLFGGDINFNFVVSDKENRTKKDAIKELKNATIFGLDYKG